ncbi:MAG: DMT family transporter [Proteobacteria bacterium]|nr:DMT family transporter [Pseudomonadota bacterium]
MTAGELRGRDIALLMLVCLTWACNFLTSAIALREVPPILFTALRFILLLIPLLPLMRRPPHGQWPRLIASSPLIGVLHFTLGFVSVKLAGQLASPAILMQSYVPMTPLLAWWLLGERFGWRTGLAIATSFVGVLVLGLDPDVLAKPMASVAMLVAALMLAIATIVMKGQSGISVWSQQGWMAALSIIPLLALSAWLEPGAFAQLPHASWKAWFGVAFAAYVSSLLGHGLYYTLVQRRPVAQLMPWLLLVPVFAIALGIAFYGDRPGARVWIGGALVLGGVFAIAIRQLQRGRQSISPPVPET